MKKFSNISLSTNYQVGLLQELMHCFLLVPQLLDLLLHSSPARKHNKIPCYLIFCSARLKQNNFKNCRVPAGLRFHHALVELLPQFQVHLQSLPLLVSLQLALPLVQVLPAQVLVHTPIVKLKDSVQIGLLNQSMPS